MGDTGNGGEWTDRRREGENNFLDGGGEFPQGTREQRLYNILFSRVYSGSCVFCGAHRYGGAEVGRATPGAASRSTM